MPLFFTEEASAPTDLMAVQEGATNVSLSWLPPSSLGYTTGYRIYYKNGSDIVSKDVSGGSTNNYLLTGLQNGVFYTIFIVGTSAHFPSKSMKENIGLGL